MRGFTNQVCEMDMLKDLQRKTYRAAADIDGLFSGTRIPSFLRNLCSRVEALEKMEKEEKTCNNTTDTRCVQTRDLDRCPLKKKMDELSVVYSELAEERKSLIAQATQVSMKIIELEKKIDEITNKFSVIEETCKECSKKTVREICDDENDETAETGNSANGMNIDEVKSMMESMVESMINVKVDKLKHSLDDEVSNKIDGEIIFLEERMNKKFTAIDARLEDLSAIDNNDEEEADEEEDLDGVIDI